MKIAIIPAYKPDITVVDIIKELIENDLHVVLVDDGSIGESVKVIKIIEDLFGSLDHFEIIKHTENKGKGEAIKTAIRHIKKLCETSSIVTVDADGQHDVADAVGLINEVSPSFDMILGQRTFGGDIPFRSKFGNILTIILFTIFTGKKIMDTQTGLRAFHSKFYDDLLTVKGSRYEWEFGVLLKFVRENRRIKQRPIKTIYEPGNPSSHFRKIRDSFRIYKQFLSFSLIGVSSAIIDYIIFIVLLLAGVGSIIALCISRMASGLVHFSLLRSKMGFKQNVTPIKSLFTYIFFVCINLLIVGLFIRTFEQNILQLISLRVVLDVLLFMFSFYVVKYFVFNREE
jgi:glycosyltransferase involved in cell wall biosynthesis